MRRIQRREACLCRCTLSSIKRLAARKEVMVYGYNSFFSELCEERHLEQYVSRLFDNNPHVWGETVRIGRKDFEIENPKKLHSCLAKETTLVIIAPYYELLHRQLCKINSEISIYYYRTKEDRRALRYQFLFKKGKTKNIMLFRSGKNHLPMFDVDDNAKVLYDYMLSHNYQSKYKMVWVVEDNKSFRKLKSASTDVVSYKWEYTRNPLKAIKYAYYLHYAQYCFFTDDCYWMRNHSENQILVSLWHGCGFKARSQKSEPTGSHYDFMTVNSSFYAKENRK
ncbi:MAG: hypothetical protein HFI63_06460 [Lachnospiraceae bacterium]|nr:hypothetical protein [Lachnospiraceae bacterium]